MGPSLKIVLDEQELTFVEGVEFAGKEHWGTQYILVGPTLPVGLVAFLKEPSNEPKDEIDEVGNDVSMSTNPLNNRSVN